MKKVIHPPNTLPWQRGPLYEESKTLVENGHRFSQAEINRIEGSPTYNLCSFTERAWIRVLLIENEDKRQQPSNGVHLARDFFALLVFPGFSSVGLAASFLSSLFM
jgi:hypothetical protein